MKRIILGTASLGSKVPPRLAREVLGAARGEGIERFDTAPLYGAGYAAALLREMPGPPVRVSTKFGSRTEPPWRYLLKRLVLARGAPELPWRNLPARQTDSEREEAQWWSAKQQRDAIERAARGIDGQLPEYMFLHGPPLVLPANLLAGLQSRAKRYGFSLGLCSPRAADVDAWLAHAPSLACVQLHLDQLLAMPRTTLQKLESGPLWVHGLYSPGPSARVQALAAREAFCVKLAERSPHTAFVIGVKSPQGVARLAQFARRIGD